MDKKNDYDNLSQGAADHADFESQLGHFLNISGTPTLVKDSHSRILIANDAACQILGLPRAALIGKTLAEELPTDEIEHFLSIDRQVLETGVPHTCEEKLTGATGHTHIVITTKTRHVDARGLRYVVAVFMDITDQKKNAERLRFQGQMLDAIAQAVISTDTRGLITYWNRAAEEIYGYRAEEVIGRPIYEVTVPQTSEQQAQEIMRQLTAGLSWSGEFMVKRRDGTTFFAQVLNMPMTDSAGMLTGILGVSADITESNIEKKRAELALARTTELLERTGELAKIGGWQIDLSTMKLSWSSQTFRIAELEPPNEPDLEGGINIFAPEARPIIAAAIQEAIATGKSYDLELPIITAKGNHRWVQTQGFAEIQNGKSVRLYGTFQDITERKQAEAARYLLESQLGQSQKLQAIGTLAGGVAHDFNNIIANILGNVNLAICEVDSKSGALGSLKEIEKSAKRARALVQQLLAFSRQQPVAREKNLLAPIVIEVARLMKSNLPKNIQLTTEIRSPEATALLDATQIEQALLNITTNAVHAIDNRPGKIRIVLEVVTMTETLLASHASLKLFKPGEDCIRIVVEDNGPGIDAKTLERIFEPFFTTKKVNTGTGLGLSVVHGIVEAHQGSMIVESEPEIRTAFLLYLVAAEIRPAENSAPGRETHILFIDDEESMVSLVKIYLERLGYRVSGYLQAENALQFLRENPGAIDLVITDFNMPGISGLDVAKAVHDIRPGLKVALASGYIDDSLNAQVARSGVEVVIPKADGMESFCDAVERLLKKPVAG